MEMQPRRGMLPPRDWDEYQEYRHWAELAGQHVVGYDLWRANQGYYNKVVESWEQNYGQQGRTPTYPPRHTQPPTSYWDRPGHERPSWLEQGTPTQAPPTGMQPGQLSEWAQSRYGDRVQPTSSMGGLGGTSGSWWDRLRGWLPGRPAPTQEPAFPPYVPAEPPPPGEPFPGKFKALSSPKKKRRDIWAGW